MRVGIVTSCLLLGVSISGACSVESIWVRAERRAADSKNWALIVEARGGASMRITTTGAAHVFKGEEAQTTTCHPLTDTALTQLEGNLVVEDETVLVHAELFEEADCGGDSIDNDFFEAATSGELSLIHI